MAIKYSEFVKSSNELNENSPLSQEVQKSYKRVKMILKEIEKLDEDIQNLQEKVKENIKAISTSELSLLRSMYNNIYKAKNILEEI